MKHLIDLGKSTVGVALAVLATSLLIASAQQSAPSPRSASAELRDSRGNVVGQATLTETEPGPVTLRITLRWFSDARAGEHGVHIHAVGQCTPTFAAAGGHFNPASHKHGFLSGEGHHAGDLPNLQVNLLGNATYEAKTSLVTLGEGANSLFDADGSSIVVHAGPDDYHTDPAGASGDRIACGVLTRAPLQP